MCYDGRFTPTIEIYTPSCEINLNAEERSKRLIEDFCEQFVQLCVILYPSSPLQLLLAAG